MEHLPADHHLPLAYQLARVLPELCIRKQGKDLPGGKLLQRDFLRLVHSQHPGIPQSFPVLLFLLHPLASFLLLVAAPLVFHHIPEGDAAVGFLDLPDAEGTEFFQKFRINLHGGGEEVHHHIHLRPQIGLQWV